MCPGQEMMLLKEVKQDHHDIKKGGGRKKETIE